MIRRVLYKPRLSRDVNLTLIAPRWPLKERFQTFWPYWWTFPGSFHCGGIYSGVVVAQTAALRSVSPQPPGTRPSRVETIQRLVQSRGFSRRTAACFARSRRDFSLRVYQAKWTVYRAWYRKEGFTTSRPSIPRLADFLIYLRESRGLSVPAIKGYRAVLGGVFRLLDIYTYRLLSALCR